MPSHAGIIEQGIYKSNSGRFQTQIRVRKNGKLVAEHRTFDTLEEARKYRELNVSVKHSEKVKPKRRPTRIKQKAVVPTIRDISSQIENSSSYIVLISKDSNVIKSILKDLEF